MSSTQIDNLPNKGYIKIDWEKELEKKYFLELNSKENNNV